MLSWTSTGSQRRATSHMIAVGLIVSGDLENLSVGDENRIVPWYIP